MLLFGNWESIGMMIKSWAAEIRNSGNGLVTSKGSATLISNGLRWKTHDMAAEEEFTAPVPDDDTYRNVPDAQRQQRYWGMAAKGTSIVIGSSASLVKRNRQLTDASVETVLSWQRQPTVPPKSAHRFRFRCKC